MAWRVGSVQNTQDGQGNFAGSGFNIRRAFDSITMLKFGRKPKLTQHQIAEAIRRRDAGEILTEIGRSYNVSHSTIIAALSC
jgi:hypothetical protein